MRSQRTRAVPKPNMTSVLIRKGKYGRSDTNTGTRPDGGAAEIGAVYTGQGAPKMSATPEAGRGKGQFFPRALEGDGHLISIVTFFVYAFVCLFSNAGHGT